MRQSIRITLCAVVVAGCAPKAGGKGGKSTPISEGRYRLGDPGQGWDRVDPGGADRAWHHAGISGTIYADSNCGKRYEDGDLDALSTHLTFGIARGEPTRTEDLTLDDRAAHVRVVNGVIDGVGVHVGSMVTKKNACLYDVLYVAPPATFDQGWPAFMSIVTGFQADR